MSEQGSADEKAKDEEIPEDQSGLETRTDVKAATAAQAAKTQAISTDSQAAKTQAVSPVTPPQQPDTVKLSSDDIIKRRSRWESSLAALRYVSSVSRDNDVKVRDSDKATSVALLIVCIVALASVALPFLAPWRLGLVGAADVLVGMGLLTYVANRFGIVTTFTPRQAVLTWQLMLGASLLGIFLAMNLGLLIAWQMYNTHIDVPGA
jgi:hypothetical protein